MALRIIICLFCGYGFGCISTAYIIGKLNHIDIREHGSGNAGTTNTLRTLGWKAGVFTYIGDFLKAVVPIIVFSKIIFADLEYSQLLGLYMGIGVMFGHNYPFWLKFKGGKGIAVTTGVMAAFDPLLIPLFIVIFFAAILFTRYVSVGSLCLAVLFPVFVAFRHQGDVHMLILSIIFMASAFFRHRTNLKRLFNGTENKIGKKMNDDIKT